MAPAITISKGYFLQKAAKIAKVAGDPILLFFASLTPFCKKARRMAFVSLGANGHAAAYSMRRY